jgi:tRNA1(Val) A37 N6-methylase TrmN6
MADVWEMLCSTAKCIVEVGANVGLFTVSGGLATRGSYVAVEPVPEIADLLNRNIARNGLAAQESPHLSDRSKNVGEERLVLQHLGEAMHQRAQPVITHGGQ